MADTFIYWVATALIGALVGGIGGVISRSTRAPYRTLLTLPALIYLLCNAVASLAALALIYAFDWKPPGISSSVNIEWVRTVLAGTLGVLLFRTTLIVGSNRRPLTVGLSQFLESILSSAAEEMGREESHVSAKKVRIIMNGVSFDKAYETLPRYCLLLRGASKEKQAQVGKTIKFICVQPMGNLEKTTLLGITLIQVVGERLLIRAVEDLGDSIR